LKKNSEIKIAVLNADEEERREISKLVTQRQYKVVPLNSLAELEVCLEKNDCIAVLMDIDSVPVDNRTIRELTLKHPEAYFLCTSKNRFHPDLKDAICYHIYACLSKPVDPQELFYWLKSIQEEAANSQN
jgi:DNA-binding NtrC family response regulator